MESRYRILFTFILLAVAVLACALPAVQSNPDTPEPTQVSQPDVPPTEAIPTIDPARYYNAEGNFSLLLPEGWSVIGPFNVDTDPVRPQSLYILGANPSPSGGPGDSKIIIADASLWTPEAFVQAQCSTCPTNPFEVVSLGGKSGWKTQVGGGGGVPFKITWFFVTYQEKLIALAIHDAETLVALEPVVQTIILHP